MFVLDYVSIVEKLTTAGYLPFAKLSQPGTMLYLTMEELKKLGMPVTDTTHLLVSYSSHNEVAYYEFDRHSSDRIGYGDYGSVYKGKNLKTGELVAIKSEWEVGGEYPDGWQLAYEQLNKHQNFVKTYAYGACNQLSISGENREFVALELIFHIMEFIQGGLNLTQIENFEWTGEQLKSFMENLLNAYETLHLEHLSGFDSSDSNVLVDVHGMPKLIDFDDLRKRSDHSLSEPEYSPAVNALPYAYRSSRCFHPTKKYSNAVITASKAIDDRIESFRQWMREQKFIRPNTNSRANISAELNTVIALCEENQALIKQAVAEKALEDKPTPVHSTTDSAHQKLIFFKTENSIAPPVDPAMDNCDNFAPAQERN